MPAHTMPPSIPASRIATTTRRLRLLGGADGDAAAEDRPEDELPLGADVPDVGAKAHREAQRDEHERRRLHRQLGEGASAAHRLDEEDEEPVDRALAEEREQADADDQRDGHGEDRREDRHEARGLRPRLEPKHARARSRAGRREDRRLARGSRPRPARGRSSTRRSPRPSRRACRRGATCGRAPSPRADR